MSLSTFKSIPWMIGIIAVLALAGAVAGTMLVNSSPTATPGMVNYVEPARNNGAEPTFQANGTDNASVATYTRFPQVRLDREPRADSASSSSLAANTTTMISPQETAAAPTSVSITPTEDWNPIFSQHTFTVTVNAADGTPAGGVEVEMFLNRFAEAVGDVVSLGGENPRKVDNYFGRVITNESGEATLTITATRPGDTDVTAYVPQIADDNAHKVFAVKHWVDMQVEFPADAVNLVGTDHPMTVRITKVSDGSPLSNVKVSWAITDNDPAATVDDAADTVTTTTDDNGETTVTLRQAAAILGDNQVLIQVHEDGTDKSMFSHTHTKQWQSPALEVDKQGPDNLGLRKTAEYTVVITNSGDTTATNVTLTDDLPEGLVFVSSVPEASSSDGSSITWSLGDMAAGASATVTMMLTADSVGAQTNTATAVSVEGITGQDTLVTEIIPGSLQLAKTAPAETISGDDLTYELTITNDGEGALTNVSVTDTLPEGFTYVSSEPMATVNEDGTITWMIESLDAEASQSMSLMATTGDPGEAVNMAAAASEEGATAMAQATTLVTQSALSIAKSVDNASILLGQPSTFTIAVTNNGNAIASNVSVVDTLPAAFSEVSATPELVFGEDGSLQWTIASIDPGATETITLTSVASEAGDYTNAVSATERGVTVDAEVDVSVLLPDIALDKTSGAALLYVDGERAYTITATNTGTAELTDVTITDNIPAEMAYVSSDNGGQESEGVVTWAVGSLAVGQSVEVTVTLTAVAVGEIVNTANVTSAEGAMADASVDIEIQPAPAPHVAIIDGVDPMGLGEQGSYTVTITNQSSNSPMTNVMLTVTIPEQLSIVTAEGGAFSEGTVTYAAVPVLEANGELTFTITVEAVDVGDVLASATLRFDEFDQPITSQEGTKIVPR